MEQNAHLGVIAYCLARIQPVCKLAGLSVCLQACKSLMEVQITLTMYRCSQQCSFYLHTEEWVLVAAGV